MTEKEVIAKSVEALQIIFNNGEELLGRVVFSCGDDSREADTLSLMNQMIANVLFDLREIQEKT